MSLLLKSVATVLLTIFGFFFYRSPELAFVLLFGIVLTVFAVAMRRRAKRRHEESEKTVAV